MTKINFLMVLLIFVSVYSLIYVQKLEKFEIKFWMLSNATM